MRTLLGLLILIQMPFVAIAFFAAGTDGKVSSQLAVWAFVIPIGLCQAYAVYRLAFGSGWPTRTDYLAAAISCAPLISCSSWYLYRPLERGEHGRKGPRLHVRHRS